MTLARTLRATDECAGWSSNVEEEAGVRSQVDFFSASQHIRHSGEETVLTEKMLGLLENRHCENRSSCDFMTILSLSRCSLQERKVSDKLPSISIIGHFLLVLDCMGDS